MNGKQCGSFTPHRGIQQGDPLSPHLFLLCAEGLVSFVEDTERKDFIQGFKVSRYAPSVSHLLFADDNLFFFLAK